MFHKTHTEHEEQADDRRVGRVRGLWFERQAGSISVGRRIPFCGSQPFADTTLTWKMRASRAREEEESREGRKARGDGERFTESA